VTLTRADVESNIREFLEKYGKEGFLELLLTNYLYELTMYYLHSEKNPPAVKEDTSYRFYVDGREQVYSSEETDAFRRDLRTECKRKARSMVDGLKEQKLIEKLSWPVSADPEIVSLVTSAFESIMKGS